MACPECSYTGNVVVLEQGENLELITESRVAVCYDEDTRERYVHKCINENGAPDMIVNSNRDRMLL